MNEPTPYLRFRLDAEHGNRHLELADKLIDCEDVLRHRGLSEALAIEDADLAVTHLLAGWNVTLSVYDPDQGPDAGPVAIIALEADHPERMS